MKTDTHVAGHTAPPIVDPYNDFMKLFEATWETAVAVGCTRRTRSMDRRTRTPF